MNIEHHIPDEEEIIPRTTSMRTAFFRDSAELLITLAIAVITFILAYPHADSCKGTEFTDEHSFGRYIGYSVEENEEGETVITPMDVRLGLSTFAGVTGFLSIACFVIFFRGKKITFQTSADKFTVFRTRNRYEVFYYSEITGISHEERRIFGIRRGFTVTVSSRIKTSVYRVICPGYMNFENSFFSTLKSNVDIWNNTNNNHETEKIHLQNPEE